MEAKNEEQWNLSFFNSEYTKKQHTVNMPYATYGSL